MPLITWDKGLETGHPLIDAQHRSMVEALEGVALASLQGDGEGSARALQLLVRTTASHFRDEEGLMAAGGYPLTPGHKARHADLLSEVRGLLDRLREDRTALTRPILDFMKVWIVV